MTACILTLHRADNCGAALQAYALQTYLSRHFLPAKILDYRCPAVEAFYAPPPLSMLRENPRSYWFRSLSRPLYRRKRARFAAFRRERLRLTRPYRPATLVQAAGEGDVFFVGSDQVWNPRITAGDPAYLLSFGRSLSTRRCAYGASFGGPVAAGPWGDALREGLSGLDFVSVREEEGRALVGKLTGRDCPVVPDPVFLLEREEWDQLCPPNPMTTPYLLVYKLAPSKGLLPFAGGLAKGLGLEVVCVPANLRDGTLGRTRLDAGPLEFLSLMGGASAVVTNSFHGSAFAALMETPFFVEAGPEEGRIAHLLESLELPRRRMPGQGRVTPPETDFTRCRERIREQRGVARRYLEACLEGL